MDPSCTPEKSRKSSATPVLKFIATDARLPSAAERKFAKGQGRSWLYRVSDLFRTQRACIDDIPAVIRSVSATACCTCGANTSCSGGPRCAGVSEHVVRGGRLRPGGFGEPFRCRSYVVPAGSELGALEAGQAMYGKASCARGHFRPTMVTRGSRLFQSSDLPEGA